MVRSTLSGVAQNTCFNLPQYKRLPVCDFRGPWGPLRHKKRSEHLVHPQRTPFCCFSLAGRAPAHLPLGWGARMPFCAGGVSMGLDLK